LARDLDAERADSMRDTKERRAREHEEGLRLAFAKPTTPLTGSQRRGLAVRRASFIVPHGSVKFNDEVDRQLLILESETPEALGPEVDIEIDRAALPYDEPTLPPRAVALEVVSVLEGEEPDAAKIKELAAPARIGDVAKALRWHMPKIRGWKFADPYRHCVDRFNGRLRLQRLLLEFDISPEQFRAADPSSYVVSAVLGECKWNDAPTTERACFVIGQVADAFMRSRGFA
jgi:hypothetical protein